MRHNPNDFNNTQQIIDYSIENGVNYFESCYFYLDYKCEKIISKALSKYSRDKYFLCGKMPVHGILETRKVPNDIFIEQLNNCNTDFFDYYLIQAVDRRALKIIEDSNLIEFLNKQKKCGLIKNIGFSFHDTPDVLSEVLDLNDWDFVQLQLNYYDWYISTGRQNYEICKNKNLPIVVMGGVKGGTLTNNLPNQAINLLNSINPKIKPVDYAYKFLTTLDNVKTILHGSPYIKDLKYNINFFSDPSRYGLYPEELQGIKQTIEIYKNKNYINCTGCGYCMSVCPQKIKIKDMFNLYNLILKNEDNHSYLKQYVEIQKGDFSSFNCIGCKRCENICPQHLNIREIFNKNIFQLRM